MNIQDLLPTKLWARFKLLIWWECGKPGAPDGYDENRDEEEWRWGFDETKSDSDNNGTNDNEEVAKVAELEWDEVNNAERPAAHSQDWSEDGKQWDPKTA